MMAVRSVSATASASQRSRESPGENLWMGEVILFEDRLLNLFTILLSVKKKQPMSISTFLDTIILLGALQGLIVAALLRSSAAQKPEESVSRRLLAAFIFLIAMCCLDIYLEHRDWWVSSPIGSLASALLPLIVAMPLGPLAYFYVRSLEEPGFRLTKAERRHFYPVVIDLLPHI